MASKLGSKIALAFALLVGLFVAEPAHAVTINFYGSNSNMGTVQIGQNGVIENLVKKDGDYLSGAAFGYLPPNSEITFTYSFFNGYGKKGDLEGEATYKQTIGNYKYSAFSSSEGDDFSWKKNLTTGKKTNVPSPILATADMSKDKKTGIVVITNNSDTNVGFGSFFTSYYESICGKGWGADDVSARYLVSSLDPASPTPLPDSLPMFAAGLMALYGFSRYRKAQAIKQ